uniref:XRN_N domain-containing protein n=1 Tax=Steinernema glaseri TaxID=37863 RepID=A0A1I8ABG5_9BILA
MFHPIEEEIIIVGQPFDPERRERPTLDVSRLIDQTHKYYRNPALGDPVPWHVRRGQHCRRALGVLAPARHRRRHQPVPLAPNALGNTTAKSKERLDWVESPLPHGLHFAPGSPSVSQRLPCTDRRRVWPRFLFCPFLTPAPSKTS